jgi:oxalate---CoA ligase
MPGVWPSRAPWPSDVAARGRVPDLVNTYLYSTIYDLLASQVERWPDSMAVESVGSVRLTYRDLFGKVQTLMRALKARDVGNKGRVAIVLPNGPELAVSMLAVSSMATSVPFNPLYRAEEYKAYFDEIRVTHLLTIKDFKSKARIVANDRQLPIIELSNDGSMTIATDGMPAAAPDQGGPPLANPESIALILLTSGSTGRSKKVPLSHRNICVSVADICRTLELTPADRCLCMWEQFHVGGLVDLLLVPLASGGAVICAGGFSAPLFYALLSKKQPTWFQGVPTTLHELAAYASRFGADPKAAPLRFIRSVASSLSPQLMQEIETLFGVPVVQTFGMTEAGPLITTNSPPPGKRRPGSVGISCGPDIRIVSPEGQDLPNGTIGEIVIRGANVISGYEDAPEANAKSFRDGWFHTGDTGYIDDEGFVFLTGRLKEMINRGGEKITPQEVDDVLLTHPEIAQAASFSIKHRTLGEDVAAAIVLRTPGSVTETDVRSFVSQRLADFKVPKRVVFLDRMPRDPIGKINRMSLAILAEAQVDQATIDDRPMPARAHDPGAGLRPVRRDALRVRARYQPPETDLQRRIAALWQEILNIDKVGLNDDFFDLGGDSLMATELSIGIQQRFVIILPPSTFLLRSTVSALATFLTGDVQAETDRCLIELQASGANPPLFLMHDMSGGLMAYRQLLHRLGRHRRVFGLQYPGGVHGSSPVASLVEMGKTYADAIRGVWPEGPYFLAGFSLGSQIAFQTASQLVASGGKVPVLALIDGPARRGKVRGARRLMRKMAHSFVHISEQEFKRWPTYILGLLWRECQRLWKRQVGRVRRYADGQQIAPHGFGDMIMAQSRSYIPPTYAGPVQLLRGGEGGGYWNLKYLGWDKYVSGPIDAYDIWADHETILQEPIAALIAAYLEKWMNEAERSDTATSALS